MATSPPAPLHTSLPNPKKRPSLGPHSATFNPSQATKRPKLHPLRQTSFPATDATLFSAMATPTARSETGSITNSLVSGISSKAGRGEKRGRGRPRKDAKDTSRIPQEGELGSHGVSGGGAADSRSQINGRGRSGRGTRSVVSGRSGGGDGDDDDEGDWGGVVGPDGDGMDKARAAEEAKKDAEKITRLTSTFTSEQQFRYEIYKRAKINKTTLKRIVNQIVSQSVTPHPLLAVQLYSKFFIGEIIERAREVQEEWAKAWDRSREEEREAEQERTAGHSSEAHKPRLVPNPHKGGLLPDHLREAMRRYKGDGEGGGTGFGSLSQGMMGVQGAATWGVGQGNGARRLFT